MNDLRIVLEVMVGTLAGLVIVVLAVRVDRMRAMFANQRFYLSAHLAKALRDRRSSVVIDAESLARAFGLGVRTLPKGDEFNGKPGPHPATMEPARRAKL